PPAGDADDPDRLCDRSRPVAIGIVPGVNRRNTITTTNPAHIVGIGAISFELEGSPKYIMPEQAVAILWMAGLGRGRRGVFLPRCLAAVSRRIANKIRYF